MANHNTITERFLRAAGITSGMRVLDIGCGHGEVSLLLAQLVGPDGAVLGIDQNDKVLDTAAHRVREQQLGQVSFLQHNLNQPLSATLSNFDALVGRRVLAYLSDPVATLSQLRRYLSPGALIMFQESDSTVTPGRISALPLHDQLIRWAWETVRREGGNSHMGMELPYVLQQAGFNVEEVRAEAVILGQGTHYSLPFLMQVMLPRMQAQGVATPEEVGLDTLEARLETEISTINSVYVTDMAFGAWGRKVD